MRDSRTSLMIGPLRFAHGAEVGVLGAGCSTTVGASGAVYAIMARMERVRQ
jgi:hypothetical protein